MTSKPPQHPPARPRIDRRERRGAATREQILDATVRSIVTHGYHALTTTMVAKAAKVSRGAMLHHFPSREAVIRETIGYLFEKRLAAFEKMVARVSAEGHRVEQSLEIYWQQARHPYFIAFFELSVAARTDKSLQAMLTPYQQALEARSLELARQLFPDVAPERLAIGLALSQAVIEHLALQHMAQKDNPLDAPLLTHMQNHIRAFYGLDGPA